jgi:acyl dehydratase
MHVVRIGETCEFEKTITADDITNYADLMGDHHPLHSDEEYIRGTHYGRPIAHGAMMVGLMSRASTILSVRLEELGARPNVSLGYNRVRFPAPVYAGDTITTTITVTEKLEDQHRVLCEERCVNQDGELVAIAEHIMRFV